MIVCSYGDDYKPSVKVGDTLRILANYPDSNAWAGSVSLLTGVGQSAVDTVGLSAYSGDNVQNRAWNLGADYLTSSLTANTTYVAALQLTRSGKVVEQHTTFRVLPQGA